MKTKKIILLFTLLLVLPILIAAPNDPGHDVLYIEQNGSSELNGSLNITSELRVTGLTQPGGLKLYGEGTIPGTDVSFITANSDSAPMYIGTADNLYLKYKGGDQVQIGVSTGVTDLNVTGVIYEQNVRVCLANGTNCLSGNNSGNVTSVSESGSTPLTFSSSTGDVQIGIAVASSGVDGYLSGADWTTFNNKGDGSGNITGSGISTRIAYWDGVGSITSTSGFTFDGTDLTLPGDINMPTSFSIGNGAVSGTSNSLAIGSSAMTTGWTSSTAIGYQANTSGSNAVALGERSIATQTGIAIGSQAKMPSGATGGISIGPRSWAGDDYALAIGYQANASDDNAIAIGYQAQANNWRGIAIGREAISEYGSVAIGYLADANVQYGVAIGSADVSANQAIAIGYNAVAEGLYGIAMGVSANASSQNSVALGTNAKTTTTNQLMIGSSSENLNTYIYGTLETTSDATIAGNLDLGTNAVLNTTAGNLTISSAAGYVIIDLG